MASGNLLYDAGNPKSVLYDNLGWGRWGGKWEGGLRGRGYMYMHAKGWHETIVWQKPLRYCKVIILQLKIKFFEKVLP